MQWWIVLLSVAGFASLVAAYLIVKPWKRWPRCRWSLALGPHVKVRCLLNRDHTYLRHHWHAENYPGPPEASVVEWTDTHPRAEVNSTKKDLEEIEDLAS